MQTEPPVETTANGITWRRASGSSNGNCVQVAQLSDGMIALRDSKNPDGPIQRYTRAEWDAFLDGAVKGEFAFSA